MYRDKEDELMRYLQAEGMLKMADVVERLQVSESTARRMFLKLEEEGRVLRIHGGIRYASPAFQDYSYDRLIKTEVEAKRAIAHLAIEQLKNGDVIFCDSGTTLSCFCMELMQYLKHHPLNLRIYTNSLANFEILTSVLPVTLIGGDFRSGRMDFSGYLAEMLISRVSFSKCFMGTDGYNENSGYFTATDTETAKLNEIAAANSKEVIILCTSEKFYTQAHVGYIHRSEVDKVITDSRMDPDLMESMENSGLQVLTAELE